MSKRTDEELIKIVTIDREGYEPLAVKSAEREIQSRNLDAVKIEEVKTDLNSKLEKQKSLDDSKVSSFIRLLNFIIDIVGCTIWAMIISFIVDLIYIAEDQGTLQMVVYTNFTISFFTYYIMLEYKFQKTLGKFITKTNVMTKEGGKPELGDIIRRTFYRLVPLDQFSYLFTRNGFHDFLSSTTVVKDGK